MSNAYKGEAELEGTPYTLRYTFNSLCLVEEKAGINLIDYFEKVLPHPNLSDMRFLLWAGLVPDNPKMTLNEAGDIMQDLGYHNIVAMVSRALKASLGLKDIEPQGEEGAVVSESIG